MHSEHGEESKCLQWRRWHTKGRRKWTVLLSSYPHTRRVELQTEQSMHARIGTKNAQNHQPRCDCVTIGQTGTHTYWPTFIKLLEHAAAATIKSCFHTTGQSWTNRLDNMSITRETRLRRHSSDDHGRHPPIQLTDQHREEDKPADGGTTPSRRRSQPRRECSPPAASLQTRAPAWMGERPPWPQSLP